MMVTRVLIAIVGCVALLAIESGIAAAQSTRAPDVFFINGKNVKVSQKLLKQMRGYWATGQIEGPFITAVPSDDRQWVLDYISIRETLREPACKQLRMLAIDKLVDKVHVLDGEEIRGGKFDELWTIEACEVERRWRVLNEAGTDELLAYEVLDAAF
jgi:hypothetical protein